MTGSSQSPRIGRAALLAIVEWLAQYRNGSTTLDRHVFGKNSHTKEFKANKLTGSDSIEEIQNGFCTEGDNQ